MFSKRMLLVIMVVAVMVNSSFVIRTESADSGDYSDSIVVSNFPGNDDIEVNEFGGLVKEVETLRTANTKHFQLADGTFEAIAFLDDIHRCDSSGKWQNIDNSLTASDGRYSTSDGYISFAEDYSADCILRLVSRSHTISISPFSSAVSSSAIVTHQQNDESFNNIGDEIDAEKIAEKANKKTEVRYDNVLEGIDIEYLISNNDVKENIIINSFNGISSFECNIKLEGLIPSLEENSVLLTDQVTGETVYIIPAPFMYDSAGNVSYDVFYELIENDSCFNLRIRADEQWLCDRERSYPVTLDPTIIAQTISKDSYVSFNNPNTNYGSWQYIRVQNDNNDQCFGLLQISMPTLPSNATITSAYLDVSYFSVYTTLKSMNVDIYGIKSAWSEGGVTWNSASSSSFMDSSPCDTGTLSCSTYAYYKNQYINTSNIVKQWCAGRSNKGIAIKYSSGNCKSLPIESKENNDSTMRPRYRIYYVLDDDVIQEGSYYIVNAKLGKLLQIDNNDAANNYSSENALLKANEFSYGALYQKWNITYLHNGYYSITSAKSSKAVSVVQGQEHSMYVSLVQQGYNGNERQQWMITKTHGGRYILRARSAVGSSSDLAMSVSSNYTSVLQGVYINNDSYLDEWRILNTSSQWYEDCNKIGYWENSPKIWYDKMNNNPGFTVTTGFAYAKNAWNNALGLSMTITADESAADIKYYCGTYDELAELGFFNGHLLYSVHGTTCILNETAQSTIPVGNQSRQCYRIEEVRGYIMDVNTTDSDYYTHLICHEMGHALGWYGHPFGYHTDWVMFSGDGSEHSIVLSDGDIAQIKRLY